MLLGFIVFCEIAFWIFLGLGLLVRYVFKLDTASKAVLLCVPILDVALLVATTIDLSSGKTAEFAHGLAAVYLGFTVMFGHSMIRWADLYVAYKFYSGESPKSMYAVSSPAKYEWLQWFKGVLACFIAAALITIAIVVIDDAQRTEALQAWYGRMFSIMLIWFIFWPLWETVFPRKKSIPQTGEVTHKNR